MDFAADTAVFLADFGVPASWSPAGGPTVTGLMLLDAPDADIASGQVVSRQYMATFATAAWPGLKTGEALTVAGVAYRLRGDPHQLDDGVFSTALLTKV